MMSFGRWTGRFFGATARRGCFVCIAAAALLAGTGVAHSGPCTAQIAAVESQIGAAVPGPKTGPTFSQTLGAQLHHQPTPQDVEHAEGVANKDADAALEQARQADAANDAAGCNAALERAKLLYNIQQ
jgi:hypothetical protein